MRAKKTTLGKKLRRYEESIAVCLRVPANLWEKIAQISAADPKKRSRNRLIVEKLEKTFRS